MDTYVLLAKGQRGLALVDLIQKVTADPSVFTFGELLDVQSIRELETTKHASSVDVLKLFSTGVWSDYKERASHLPDLNGAQQAKLKQLTVVSIAATSKAVPYTQLMTAVDVGTVRELEDLLISHCFYPRLISGSLNQRQGCLQVESATGRDVPRSALSDVSRGLDAWVNQSRAVLQQLENHINGIELTTQQAARRRQAEATAVDEARSNLRSSEKGQAAPIQDEGIAAGEDRNPTQLSRPKRRR